MFFNLGKTDIQRLPKLRTVTVLKMASQDQLLPLLWRGLAVHEIVL